MNHDRRILVTGAGGFVGGWLLDRIAAGPLAGAEVLAAGAGCHGQEGGVDLDVTETAAVDALVARFRPTAVIHLAGMASLVEAHAQSRKAWDVNLFGTMNLAEAVMKHAPDARFLHAGSAEVYGGSFNSSAGPLDETALLDPRNPYAATKAAADLMLGQMAGSGLRAVRFRPFNHTGPGQSAHFAVPAFAAQIAAAERGERAPVVKVGNLDARRDFLDVRDVVEAYCLAVSAEELPRGVVINIASGVTRRIGDVLSTMIAMSTVPIEIERDELRMRPSDVPCTGGVARRAADLLGWRPEVAWETTLHDVLDAHRRAG